MLGGTEQRVRKVLWPGRANPLHGTLSFTVPLILTGIPTRFPTPGLPPGCHIPPPRHCSPRAPHAPRKALGARTPRAPPPLPAPNMAAPTTPHGARPAGLTPLSKMAAATAASAQGPLPESNMAERGFFAGGTTAAPARLQDGARSRDGGVWAASRRKREGPSREQRLAAAGAGLAPPEQTCRRAGDTAVTTEPASANTAAATAASRAAGAGDQATSLPPPRMQRRKVSTAGKRGRRPAGGPAGSGRCFLPFLSPSAPSPGYKTGGKIAALSPQRPPPALSDWLPHEHAAR